MSIEDTITDEDMWRNTSGHEDKNISSVIPYHRALSHTSTSIPFNSENVTQVSHTSWDPSLYANTTIHVRKNIPEKYDYESTLFFYWFRINESINNLNDSIYLLNKNEQKKYSLELSFYDMFKKFLSNSQSNIELRNNQFKNIGITKDKIELEIRRFGQLPDFLKFVDFNIDDKTIEIKFIHSSDDPVKALDDCIDICYFVQERIPEYYFEPMVFHLSEYENFSGNKITIKY